MAMVADDVGKAGAQSGDDSGMCSSGAVLTRAKILATLSVMSTGCAKEAMGKLWPYADEKLTRKAPSRTLTSRAVLF